MLNSARIQEFRCYIFVVLFACLMPGLTVADDVPIIAVASNLTLPMAEIAELYEIKTGRSVRLTTGSSGHLAGQIVQGAPYELFISANRQYIDLLTEHEIQVNNIEPFIIGKIGAFIPDNSPLRTTDSIDDVINALIFRNYRKIAIANPELAPYGTAAVEALQNSGIWAIESSRVILADSVSLVIPYALSGNVDVAIIPYSFMLPDEMKQNGKYISFPENSYTPIIQYLVELYDGNTQAAEFKRFLLGELSRDILNKYGYEILLKE